MFFDLNIEIPAPSSIENTRSGQNKKGKQKAGAHVEETLDIALFSPAQVAAIEAKIDKLIFLGYTFIALNQPVSSCVVAHEHVDYLEYLVKKQLKQREGIFILKRLTVLMDDASEKSIGFTKNNETLLARYDILSLAPTTLATFSAACLTYSQPSSWTAHIISLPLLASRIPFFYKHTLVRTALKHGAVFELGYSPAVGKVPENERRNWWASVAEVVRVTKGKGCLLSSGDAVQFGLLPSIDYLRAPDDVANLLTVSGFAPDLAKHAISSVPKEMLVRAKTRKTYRAVISETVLIFPSIGQPTDSADVAMDGIPNKRARDAVEEPLNQPTKKKPKAKP